MIGNSNDASEVEANGGSANASRVLVTGASGFIGKWLCKSLRELGHEVVGLSQHNGDISQKNYFEKYLELEVGHVFHLASRTFVPTSWEDPRAFYATNVIGTLNALEFCRAKHIPISYVSAYIYGTQESQPISENAQIHPSNPYANSKVLAEQLCKFYAEKFAVRCTVVRPFNIYGHGQSDKFLIPTIINQVLHSPEIRVKDLRPRRDYLYIKDFLDILVQTMNSSSQFCVYNAGSGYSLSVLEVIGIIKRICDKDKPIKSEKLTRRSEIDEVIADITRLRTDYGWAPKYTFEAGITDIIMNERRAIDNENR